MSSSRIVAVFGATGLQGSSVVQRLLKDATFTPRAITRNPDSAASLKLKESGVDVVKVDPGDKASLVDALRGAEAVFGVCDGSDFASAVGGNRDRDNARKEHDRCGETGVKFFVFSSLPGITKLSGGKYTKVAPYDDKAEVEEYLKSSGLANASILLGGFVEGLWTRPHLQKTATGFNITVPKYSPTQLEAWTWVEHDVGESVLALIKSYTDPSKNVSGRSYPVVTANLTYPDLAAMASKGQLQIWWLTEHAALGVEVTFTSVASSGHPVLDEMFASHAEYNGLYPATPVPNPDLVALGAKFGTMEELMDTEMKRRFAQ
ncbi:hypothetical protein DFH06DRAFT_1009680 [Mycena polygramma]|nr:hypothetical protein DFH06DRAFT_1009680 [Mycena polygramma]